MQKKNNPVFHTKMKAFPENFKSAVLDKARQNYEAEKENWKQQRRRRFLDDLVFLHTLHYSENRIYHAECEYEHLDWELEVLQELAQQSGVTVTLLVDHYETNDHLQKKKVRTEMAVDERILNNRDDVTRILCRISFE